MNCVELFGRLTRHVDVKFTQGDEPLAVARFTVAVNRQKKGEADFISCVAFGKTADYLGKYGEQGMQIAVSGRIQTGSYQKGSEKVYTTDVIADRCELVFKSEDKTSATAETPATADGFMQATFADGGLPFN